MDPPTKKKNKKTQKPHYKTTLTLARQKKKHHVHANQKGESFEQGTRKEGGHMSFQHDVAASAGNEQDCLTQDLNHLTESLYFCCIFCCADETQSPVNFSLQESVSPQHHVDSTEYSSHGIFSC